MGRRQGEVRITAWHVHRRDWVEEQIYIEWNGGAVAREGGEPVGGVFHEGR